MNLKMYLKVPWILIHINQSIKKRIQYILKLNNKIKNKKMNERTINQRRADVCSNTDEPCCSGEYIDDPNKKETEWWKNKTI